MHVRMRLRMHACTYIPMYASTYVLVDVCARVRGEARVHTLHDLTHYTLYYIVLHNIMLNVLHVYIDVHLYDIL